VKSTVTQLQPRSPQQRELPHLPPVARDPIDDAKEALEAFAAWQPDKSDLSRDELAESLGAALRALLPMVARSQRRELPPWKRLPVEQARMFIDQLADLPRDSEIDCARELGRLEVHAQRLLDVIDSEVAPW
jgi:hypothetical protein